MDEISSEAHAIYDELLDKKVQKRLNNVTFYLLKHANILDDEKALIMEPLNENRPAYFFLCFHVLPENTLIGKKVTVTYKPDTTVELKRGLTITMQIGDDDPEVFEAVHDMSTFDVLNEEINGVRKKMLHHLQKKAA